MSGLVGQVEGEEQRTQAQEAEAEGHFRGLVFPQTHCLQPWMLSWVLVERLVVHMLMAGLVVIHR